MEDDTIPIIGTTTNLSLQDDDGVKVDSDGEELKPINKK